MLVRIGLTDIFWEKSFPVFLFVYHLCFSWFALNWAIAHGGDANQYWFIAADLSNAEWLDFLKPGTPVVQFLTFPLVNYFQLPFWSGFLLFSAIGGAAIVILYQLVLEIFAQKYFYIGVILLLLPGIHFWTSLIGKEPLVFLFSVLLFRNILTKPTPFILQNILWLALLGWIRPHYALLILLSLIISVILSKNRKQLLKINIWFPLLLFVLAGGATLYFIQDWSSNPLEKLWMKYEVHRNVLASTSAHVPLHDYPFIVRLFLFYFGPLDFAKEAFYWKIFSLENIVLLIIFCRGIYAFFKRKFMFRKIELPEIFTIIYFFIFGTAFIFGYENYGLIYRTKIMTLPFIYFVLFKKENFTTESFDPDSYGKI